MSGVFGVSREAVRVKVKKCEASQPPEFRKFSVDPQITSFEVLQSILTKAFDLKGDFAICYRPYDLSEHENYLPLVSDWDLDAAFLKAYNSCEPCLCLRVDLKPFEEGSDDWELKQNVPRFRGIINQVGKTLNLVQRALNFGEDGGPAPAPPRLALTDSEFRAFLDPVGQILYAKELRTVIYFGGIEPSLRKVVWKHLLNVYPDGMTGRDRMDYIKRKAAEYVTLRETWKTAIAQGPVGGELAYTTGMVRKDVLRTDRHHPFYAGSDDNQNIASLFNILTTYALNHPKVSYCQGMSDLASPLLVTMNDEAHAYICFCALMKRLCTNFMIDGIAMTQKFTHLAEGLMYYDSEFYNYLKLHQADDLLFCYRWLLLEMKREFAFEDSLRMLEVLWSSLPSDPPYKELKLYDVQFQSVAATPPISPLVKTPRESAYTKVCALRRQSSSLSLSSFAAVKPGGFKRQNHSLDETTTRSKNNADGRVKHQSLDDATLTRQKAVERPRSVSPLHSRPTLSSSMTSLIKNTKKSGHFKDLKDKIAAAKLFSSLDRLDGSITEEVATPQGKIVKNLNEFLSFAAVNKNRISDKFGKRGESTDHPKILLTKSSCEEYSPEDSQEYFPVTLDLENLDRMSSPSTCSSEIKADDKKRNDDVFLWENPLLGKQTPDEQADIEYDGQIPVVNGAHMTNSCEEVTEVKALLPPPNEFGGGNPFLMFLCITVLSQHRNHIISKSMDYNEMAMHFDKMVRKHNVTRVLNQARQMYAGYIKQHTIAQQKRDS